MGARIAVFFCTLLSDESLNSSRAANLLQLDGRREDHVCDALDTRDHVSKPSVDPRGVRPVSHI